MPALFRETNGWKADYRRYHSPVWWRNHLAASGLFEVLVAKPDKCCGRTMCFTAAIAQGGATRSLRLGLIRQIAHGQTDSPTLTRCIVCAERKA